MFGGYPISNNSIEVLHENYQGWKQVFLEDGNHIINPFWAGAYLSDKLDGSIFIFGGGLKYSDSFDCYDYNADKKSMKKL